MKTEKTEDHHHKHLKRTEVPHGHYIVEREFKRDSSLAEKTLAMHGAPLNESTTDDEEEDLLEFI